MAAHPVSVLLTTKVDYSIYTRYKDTYRTNYGTRPNEISQIYHTKNPTERFKGQGQN